MKERNLGRWGAAWETDHPWGLGLLGEGPSYDLWFCLSFRLGPLAVDLFFERKGD